ncbi:phosphoglycolate phosphatase [Alkalilimnicola ehrlichii]|uniref:Phosphoglycolate phosphatase n=1 Tax=Alkalilimnicola ehrlichii TaxID=351052 RepID=A0A3E0WYD7_9GAMM|nr:HAD-IA family hydrolase [Alkalilimnicola ehrlichii]RFA27749.1 phosphoglycolate phosphatase [Alkalilimnicola ehrlichii]RFA36917.1 phosphoglycolate phosphatase [Alkalilimnicola ehrlichii]
MPLPPQARAVLLDLDGTLLDTAPDLIGALNTLRGEHGKTPLPEGHLQPVVSHGSAAMVQRGFDLAPDTAGFEALRQRFLALYRARVSQATRAFPGMDELIDLLDERGIPWGVVTNKPGWLTEPLLADLGYAPRAACIVSGDTLAARKPDPGPILLACKRLALAPCDCVLVGDAERDIEAGRRAGALTLAALFGYICGEDHVRRWGADGIISHPEEILRWLDPELLGQIPRQPEWAATGS